MDATSTRDLEEKLALLTARVWRLEELLRRQGALVEQPQPQAVAPEIAAARIVQGAAPAHFPPPPPPSFPSVEPGKTGDRSLESRIGSQWFNRIGILAVLIGMAWFLKLAIDNHWIGPLGRILIGLLSGAALVAWSERFRSRGFAAFSYSLKAVGSGILYLSLWAAFALFHLIPSSVAFAAMILVTAFNGFMCWAQDSELLALYAIVGGFSTPLLLSTGENHEITLFSYLLSLNVASLVLLILRPWSRLLLGAFTGTVLFFVGWSLRFYSDTQFAPTAFFLAVFFLLFAFAPRLIRVDGESDAMTRRDSAATVLLPLANAVLGFLGFYLMLDQAGDKWAQPWTAVAFAAFYLLLLRLPTLGPLRDPSPQGANQQALGAIHLTVAVVFLTIAIPLKAHGRWLTIGWLVEGAALLWLAVRVQSRYLRGLALLALLLGLGALLVINPPTSTTVLFNRRFATYLVGIAVFAFTAVLSAKTEESGEEFPVTWQAAAGAAVLVVNALILLAAGWEIHNYWWHVRYTGSAILVRDYRMEARFTYSAFFMLFGAILLACGFWKRSAFLRWQALVLLAVSIGKVFLVDVSALSQGYRILSFLGLGVLLLGVSFVYQRDWLNLRGAAQRHP